MTKKKNDDAFNETIIKGKTSKDMEKHINRLLYGTDYPKVYDKPEDEAKIDPEGFFPKDLYTHGTASQVIELIQEHRNRIAEALPKLRKGEYFDEALASSRALVKRVYEGTYDIYSGTENSIEWLR